MAYNQNNSQGRNDRVRFDLMERIGVLSRKDNGWTREVNIVSWNDGPGKVDIREWDPDHKRMTRGVTLFEDEAENLTKVLARRYGLFHPGSGQNRILQDERQGHEESPVKMQEGSLHERSFGEHAGYAHQERARVDMAAASADEAAEDAAATVSDETTAVPVSDVVAACVAESASHMDLPAPAMA